MRTVAAVAAARPLHAAARLHRAQLLRAALSAARPGDRDHLLHAVHRGGARRPDPRRMDPAGGAGPRSSVGFCGVLLVTRPGAGGIHPAALLSFGGAICYAIYSISTRILARTDSNETTNFYSNLVGAVLVTHRGAVHLDAAERSDGHPADVLDGPVQRDRALSADHGPPPRAGLRAGAVHLHRDRLDDRARLSRVRRRAEPLDARRRRGRDRVGALPALPRARGRARADSPVD